MRFARNALWIVLDGEDTVVRVDAEERPSTGVVPPERPRRRRSSRSGRVYVSSEDNNTVVVLDPEDLQPVGEPIPVGYNPGAMVADDRSVWVVGLGDDSLMRIDYR